jgi:hypothetical protein
MFLKPALLLDLVETKPFTPISHAKARVGAMLVGTAIRRRIQLRWHLMKARKRDGEAAVEAHSCCM